VREHVVSVFKPFKRFDKKELIEQALKDLDPSLREHARVFLEELDSETLADPDKVKDYLRKRGLLIR